MQITEEQRMPRDRIIIVTIFRSNRDWIFPEVYCRATINSVRNGMLSYIQSRSKRRLKYGRIPTQVGF